MSKQPLLPLGDELFTLGMWAWLTWSVGPWWVGASLFVGCAAINYLTRGVYARMLARQSEAK
jgi:type IV secretory pathway TrbD component